MLPYTTSYHRYVGRYLTGYLAAAKEEREEEKKRKEIYFFLGLYCPVLYI